jgi:hypothetical protein
LTSTTTNAKDRYQITLDCEENSIGVRPVSEEQLPDFNGKYFVFRREHAAARQLRQGQHCILKALKPAEARITRILGDKPIQDVI